MTPLALIGLDAGVTSAYVVLGLNGQVLKAHAAKDLPLSEIIRQVMEVCQPVIVGTDKAKVPSLVEEFSRKVGALIVTPDEDLLREEKKALVDSCSYYNKSHHIQDSLASALFAYRKYHPKLLKIGRFIREQQLEEIRDEFTLLALKEGLHFSLIKDILTRKTEEHQIIRKVTVEQKAEPKITKKDFLTLLGKVQDLSLRNSQLQKQLQIARQQLQVQQQEKRYLEKRVHTSEKKIDSRFAFKEKRLQLQGRELERKQQQIQALEQEIGSLYSFMAAIPQYQLLKKLPTLSQKDFQERKGLLAIQPNDVLWVENTAIYSEQVLQELAGQGIVILSPQKISALVQKKFFSFHWPERVIGQNDYFLLLGKASIEAQLARQEVVEKIVKEYKQERDLEERR